MAKGAYIGIDGIARKIKSGYVGVTTEIPVYETITEQFILNTTNLSKFFDVTDGTSYTWTKSDVSGGGIKLVPGNIGKNSSTATITLKAKVALTNVVIKGAYYTESNYDKITLTSAGSTLLDAVSGSNANVSSSPKDLSKDILISIAV